MCGYFLNFLPFIILLIKLLKYYNKRYLEILILGKDWIGLLGAVGDCSSSKTKIDKIEMI